MTDTVHICTPDEAWFSRKVEAIYEAGNNPRNHDMLLALFHQLWRFSRVNQCDPNDIEFQNGRWDGPRRMLVEVDWIEADDWQRVESLPIVAKKYSEWTAILLRGVETVSHTVHRPVREITIESISWRSSDVFAVAYTECA